MYKLAYYSQFYDINNNLIRVEIYRFQEKALTPIELTLAANAISIQYESDSIFKPLKLSGCSINVLTKNVLSDLYTGKINDVQIRIYKNNSLFWLGYNSPNIYSQEYKDDLDLMTIEGIDTLSFLEYKPYQYYKNNEMVSFIDIIYSILSVAEPNKIIKNIYVHSSINYKLDQLAIFERNFFDEEGEAEKMKEVLADLFSYLGMTLIQYQDSFLILDYEALKKGITDFTLYDRTTLKSTLVTLPESKFNLSEVGVAESNCTISLGDVFNKISIIANTNQVENVIPDAIEDENAIINYDENPFKIWESTTVIDKKEYTLLNSYFKHSEEYYSSDFTLKKKVESPYGSADTEDVTQLTGDNIDDVVKGSFIQKCVDYKTDEEPSSLKWKSYLSFINHSYSGNWDWQLYMMPDVPYIRTPYLNLEKKPTMIVKGGYFIISMKFKYSQHNRANSCLKSDNTITFNNLAISAKDVNTYIPCRLVIGNYFYDGDSWVNYDEYNAKVENGYYKYIRQYITTSGDYYWYKIRNQFGYWEYVHKSTYEASTAEKLSGKLDIADGIYFLDESYTGNKEDFIWVEPEYFHECFLGDRFYLIRKNQRDEQCFDTEMTLTNTVSWRMQLADSNEGVAIKLPDQVIQGQLEFQLFQEKYLGSAGELNNGYWSAVCKAMHISELKLIYTTSDTVENIYTGKSYDPDILYSNEINENYVTELNDIKLKINTYNPKATSYSYVIDLLNNDFLEETYNYATNETKLQEHHLIQKYYNHYSTPKFIYQNVLKNKGITPYSIIKENTLNKDMLVNNVVYDLANDSVDVQLIEI